MNYMGKLSLFRNYSSKIPLMEESVGNIVKTIRCGEALRSITERYRASGDKRSKEDSPMFGVAARFDGGKTDKHVAAMTELTMVDIDGVAAEKVEELRAKANADPHTLLSYVTISGKGLRILCSYAVNEELSLIGQKKEYAAVFAACNDYYGRLLGMETDRKCKNVSRLSGMAHDPLAYYNPEAETFSREWIEQEKKAVEAKKKHRKACDKVEKLYKDRLKAELESEGIVYAPGSHNDYVMRLGYKLNQFGIAVEAAVAWAVEKFSDYDATEQVIRSCYRHTDEHGSRKVSRQSAGGNRLEYATVTDLEAYVAEHARLRKNTITHRYEYQKEDGSWENVTDCMVNSLWAEMSKTMNMRVNPHELLRVIESDNTPDHHPFHDYLESLPQWKEGNDKDHIAELAATVTVKGGEKKQEFFARCLKKWLVGMVKGWICQQTVNQQIFVLIGKQGVYKTTWFNHLLPPALRRYVRTKPNSQHMTKDDLLSLTEYGLICCEELDTMKPAERDQLKAAVTMVTVDERAAYARYAEQRHHIASFCGTGNNTQFLSDPTGNRRWLPFEVDSILSPWENELDYEGIYSQAYTLLQSGFIYWFSEKELDELALHNHHFETPNMEEELVMTYFEKPHGDRHGEYMTTAGIMQYIGANITQKLSAVSIGRAMSKMGFEKRQVKNVRGYIVMKRTAQEIIDYQKRIAVNPDTDE